MRRLLAALMIGVTIAAAIGLYSTVLSTRQLAQRVQALERLQDRAEADVAVLRAERAHLARPQRIDELARRMGLVAAEPVRIGLDSLPAR